MKLRHASLFSGIGGFDYAAERMGWENVFHCEINPFGRTVLNYYWPGRSKPSNLRDVPTRAPFLLQTPRASENDQGPTARAGILTAGSSWKGQKRGATVTTLAMAGLLPTPRTTDVEGGKINNLEISETGKFSRKNANGVRFGVKLRDVMENGFLPTPRASEFKGTGPIGSSSHDHRLDRGYLDGTMQEITGESGQLNPLFVEEMMGFPTGWIVQPFLAKTTQEEPTLIPDGELKQ